jgi:hypothetical protein
VWGCPFFFFFFNYYCFKSAIDLRDDQKDAQYIFNVLENMGVDNVVISLPTTKQTNRFFLNSLMHFFVTCISRVMWSIISI